MTPKIKALYQRVGPTLFARARRVLKDDATAESVVQQVVLELSRHSEMKDAELLTTGREMLKKHLAEHKSVVDSIDPTGD